MRSYGGAHCNHHRRARFLSDASRPPEKPSLHHLFVYTSKLFIQCYNLHSNPLPCTLQGDMGFSGKIFGWRALLPEHSHCHWRFLVLPFGAKGLIAPPSAKGHDLVGARSTCVPAVYQVGGACSVYACLTIEFVCFGCLGGDGTRGQAHCVDTRRS